MLVDIWNFFLCIFNGVASGLKEYNSQLIQNKYLRGENARLEKENDEMSTKLHALTHQRKVFVKEVPEQVKKKPPELGRAEPVALELPIQVVHKGN